MSGASGQIKYRCALWRTYRCKNYVWVDGTKCTNCQSSRIFSALVSGYDSSNPNNYWLEPKPFPNPLGHNENSSTVEEDVYESIETDVKVEDEIHDSLKTAINAVEHMIESFEESDYKIVHTHVDTKQEDLQKKPST